MSTHPLLLKVVAIWFLVTLSFFLASAQSKTSSEAPFDTGVPVIDKVVVEDQYFFTIRRFSPSVQVKPVSREKASYVTPESATIAAISAMVAGDYEWFRSTWDQPSIAILDQQDKKLKQDAKFWTDTWAKALKGKKVELTARIETGKYVLIAYRLVVSDQNNDSPITQGNGIELVTVLKLTDGKWLATQELMQDPVLLYWKTPNVKPKRIIRGINETSERETSQPQRHDF